MFVLRTIIQIFVCAFVNSIAYMLNESDSWLIKEVVCTIFPNIITNVWQFSFSKEEILHHEEQYEPFYASFCVLAADYLASNAHQGEFFCCIVIAKVRHDF